MKKYFNPFLILMSIFLFFQYKKEAVIYWWLCALRQYFQFNALKIDLQANTGGRITHIIIYNLSFVALQAFGIRKNRCFANRFFIGIQRSIEQRLRAADGCTEGILNVKIQIPSGFFTKPFFINSEIESRIPLSTAGI